MSLLGADLRALGNLPASATGRRVAVGTATGLGLLALMSWWLADTIASQPRILELIAGGRGTASLQGLCGYGLLACPLVATWLGLAMAQRQLFETPELWLWRTAPIPAWRGPLQILLRAAFVSTLWAASLAGPFVVAVLQRHPARPLAYVLLPVAIAVCTMPLLATLLAVQVVLVRFLAGRLLKLVLAGIAAVASVGFSTWLLLNLFSSGRDRVQDVAAAATSGNRLPWSVDAAAALLADAADGAVWAANVVPVLGWLGASLTVFGAAASLHGRAHERYLEAEGPLWRSRGRRWPAALVGNVRRKELAQVLQQPGALIGFLVFAVLVFGLAKERVLVAGMLDDRWLPRDVRHLGAMLALWFLAVLLVLYAHMGRLALWDGAQWPLYMASPAPPRAILAGKLSAVAVFLLWPVVLVAAAGVRVLDAGLDTTWRFVVMALGGTAAALGVLAVVGTWPRLMRPDAEGQILQGGKSFLAAMVLVTAFEAIVAPAVFGWLWLADVARRGGLQKEDVDQHLPWVVFGALSYGAIVAAVGIWLGGRNYRRLLAPR